MNEVETAVLRLYEARKAAREAKVARQKKAEELGHCESDSGIEDASGPCYGDVTFPKEKWCAACKGKLPTWEDYHHKANMARAALAAVTRMGKSLSMNLAAAGGKSVNRTPAKTETKTVVAEHRPKARH